MTESEAKAIIKEHKKQGCTENVKRFLDALSIAGSELPAKATLEDYYKWSETEDE